MTLDPARLPVLCLMGATASGKSALALRLAAELPVELVSVDSAQVYRGLDIGSAKPGPAERAAVPHHLIDLLDPAESYSAARFREDAAACVAAIRQRGRLPVLVGGTFLYFRALMGQLSELPRADPALRARLAEEARQLGWPALHARLAALDPRRASQLHPNDGQRIQRALEILLSGARPAPDKALAAVATGGGYLRVVLDSGPREQLHERIAERFRRMLAEGLLEEVRALHRRGDLHPELPAIRSVGYRQLWAHLDGEQSLEQATEQAIAATRQLAKRQLTWLRQEPADARIEPGRVDAVQALLQLLQRRNEQAA